MTTPNGDGTITPHHGPEFILDRDAIVALHAATGQEATEEAYAATRDHIYADYCDRAVFIMQSSIDALARASETGVVPGQVRQRCWSQSRIFALEEVLEDHIHAPIRHARERADDPADLTVTNPVVLRRED